MQITTTKSTGGGFVSLVLTHGDEHLGLMNTTFARTTISDHDKLFSITNSILAKLSEEKQERIFEIYEEVSEITTRVSLDLTKMIELLAGLTNELYALLDLTEVNVDGEISLKSSLLSRNEYHIPDTLKSTYNENHKRELTYLRDDYIGLCALAEALRFALPIWIPFMRYRQEEIGTAFKEFTAAGLIYGADIYKTLQVNRLITYVDAIISNVRLPLAAIHAGLSDTESGEFMTALAVIRKIAIGETQIPTVDLICNVSNYTRKSLTQLPKRFDSTNRVIESPSPSDKSGDDNTSKAENPRLKERLPLSRYEETKYFIRSSPMEIIETITGKRPTAKLYRECQVAVNKLERWEVNLLSRLKIVASVIRKSKIAPNMLDVLDHKYRVRLTVIAAVSLTMGDNIPTLNLLLSKLSEAGESLMMGNSLNSAVSNNTLLALNAMYYMDEPELVNAAARRVNLAHTAIQSILDELSDYDMEANLPRTFDTVGPIDRNDRYGEDLALVLMNYDFDDPYSDKNKLAQLASKALEQLNPIT